MTNNDVVRRDGAYKILEARYGAHQAREMLFAGVSAAYKQLETLGYRYHRSTQEWEKIMLPNRVKRRAIYSYASVTIICKQSEVDELIAIWNSLADLASYEVSAEPRAEQSDYEDRVRLVLRFRKEVGNV